MTESSPYEVLTPRQVDIVRLVAKSYTEEEIGDILELSAKTIQAHKSSIYKRLGFRDLASLTRYAIRHGLITAHE